MIMKSKFTLPPYPRVIAELADSDGIGRRLVEHEDRVVFEDDSFDDSFRDANGELPNAEMFKSTTVFDGVQIDIDDPNNVRCNLGHSARREMLIFLAELLIQEQADDFASGGRDALWFLMNRLFKNNRIPLSVCNNREPS